LPNISALRDTRGRSWYGDTKPVDYPDFAEEDVCQRRFSRAWSARNEICEAVSVPPWPRKQGPRHSCRHVATTRTPRTRASSTTMNVLSWGGRVIGRSAGAGRNLWAHLWAPKVAGGTAPSSSLAKSEALKRNALVNLEESAHAD